MGHRVRRQSLTERLETIEGFPKTPSKSFATHQPKIVQVSHKKKAKIGKLPIRDKGIVLKSLENGELSPVPPFDKRPPEAAMDSKKEIANIPMQLELETPNPIIDADSLSYEDLDKEIERQLEASFQDLDQLKIDRKKIGDPHKLVDSISQVVWEQFLIQIAGTASSDFVKSNHDLKLSLKKADHYLNEDSFAEGKMPTHNFAKAGKYQERYDTVQKNFKRNEDGSIATHTDRTGIEKPTLSDDARKRFDKGRPTGSRERGTSEDHTIPVAEILRNKKASAFLDDEEKVGFANSEANLREMRQDWNSSKGDMTTPEWLDNPNKNGQKPREIFDMSEKEEQKLRDDDKAARGKWNETLEKGEKRANDEGRASRLDEAGRSAQYTIQAIAVSLMAKLVRNVFQEVIRWMMEKDHKSKDLIGRIKKAITNFVLDFKNNILLSVDVGVMTILTQLFGEIIPMIRKALIFVSIGGKSVWDVVKYLKDSENAEKDTSTKVLEIGEIVVTALTASGAIALGAGITCLLVKYAPPLATFQIPLLGSAAGLLGTLFGGLTAGICGAIVMNAIEGSLASRMLNENTLAQIDKTNEILGLQNMQFALCEAAVNEASTNAANNIRDDFTNARDELERIKKEKDEPVESDNEDNFNDLSKLIGDLEG